MLLHCRCHERRDDRCFRLDRIRTVIDLDGVVHENAFDYLVDLLGVRVSGEPTEASSRQSLLRNTEPAAVRLAVMLAQADGRIGAQELNAIVEWIVPRCQMILRQSDLSAFGRYLKGLRLTGEMVASEVRQLEAKNSSRRREVLELFRAVVDADGHEHPAEAALLNEISTELRRRPKRAGAKDTAVAGDG